MYVLHLRFDSQDVGTSAQQPYSDWGNTALLKSAQYTTKYTLYYTEVYWWKYMNWNTALLPAFVAFPTSFHCQTCSDYFHLFLISFHLCLVILLTLAYLVCVFLCFSLVVPSMFYQALSSIPVFRPCVFLELCFVFLDRVFIICSFEPCLLHCPSLHNLCLSRLRLGPPCCVPCYFACTNTIRWWIRKLWREADLAMFSSNFQDCLPKCHVNKLT